jgi:hypothetical protein
MNGRHRVSSRPSLAAAALALALGGPSLAMTACNKTEAPAGAANSAPANSVLVAAPGAAGCTSHAVCADDFFIDAVPPDDCAVGAVCTVTFKLVATGNFHVNDEYPYRFKAADVAGVAFAGTDTAGKNVFSKPAGDWRKVDEKGGAMTVRFTAADKGSKTIGGTFKLSVCSAATCLLEQREVSAVVAAK